MSEHPIENLMNTAMNSIKDMIDVDTIIGAPIETSNNVVIIPISKVGFGFAAGGSEFSGETVNEYMKKEKEEQVQYRLPFGGGSGAGVSISPVAFLVVSPDNVRLLPVDHSSCIDRLLDYVPDLIERMSTMLDNHMKDKKEERIKEIKKITTGGDKKNGKGDQEEIKKEEVVKEETKEPQSYRPKKAKLHKPIAEYEFEYDETEEEDDDLK